MEKKKRKTTSIILFLFLTFIISNSACFGQNNSSLKKYWLFFKEEYIKEEYVNDKYFKFSTHSEAQGIGLLFSEYFDDYKTFLKVWTWTKNNLQIRKTDNLFAWLWGKDHKGNWRVLDYNNATDADILIAWALIKAGKKWKRNDLVKEGIKIINDIEKELIIKWNDIYILLPGYTGFIKQDTIIVNPSYYITPAFKDFYELTKNQIWIDLIKSQEIFLNYRLGIFHLIPDWIELSNKKCYQPKRKYIFGYEAIRFYLYNQDEPFRNDLKSFIDFFFKRGNWVPDQVFLEKNLISINDSPAGFYAVFSKTYPTLPIKQLLNKKAEEKIKYDKSYYSLSLYILTNIIK